MAYEFHYTPTGTGAISGTAVLEQTEDAINDLGNTAISGVQEALDKAEQALTNSENAVDDAQTALNTANNAEGVVLIVGPTGSGKSSTMYTMVKDLNSEEVNLVTLEDPVEYNIDGINQVQVNTKAQLTFASALRSILRQDPDIIMIGEIRDQETASIAVQASITGHLVISTLHTNNSLATIERLLDMDVERYLLSSALSGIISQRLAKMLCPNCRYQRETTKYEKKVFKKFMNMDVDKVCDANPRGCEHCRHGYKGRIALHEVLEIDDEIKEEFLKISFREVFCWSR